MGAISDFFRGLDLPNDAILDEERSNWTATVIGIWILAANSSVAIPDFPAPPSNIAGSIVTGAEIRALELGEPDFNDSIWFLDSNGVKTWIDDDRGKARSKIRAAAKYSGAPNLIDQAIRKKFGAFIAVVGVLAGAVLTAFGFVPAAGIVTASASVLAGLLAKEGEITPTDGLAALADGLIASGDEEAAKLGQTLKDYLSTLEKSSKIPLVTGLGVSGVSAQPPLPTFSASTPIVEAGESTTTTTETETFSGALIAVVGGLVAAYLFFGRK